MKYENNNIDVKSNIKECYVELELKTQLWKYHFNTVRQ